MFGNAMQQAMGGVMQQAVGGMMQQAMSGMMGKGQNNGQKMTAQQMFNCWMENPEIKSSPFIAGKSQKELAETFYNLCREHNINPQYFAQRFGISLPPEQE